MAVGRAVWEPIKPKTWPFLELGVFLLQLGHHAALLDRGFRGSNNFRLNMLTL